MTLFGALGPSLAQTVKSNRGLYKWVKPFANWYAGLSGYRKIGLKYDDLRACVLCGHASERILSGRALQSLRSVRMSSGCVAFTLRQSVC